MPRRVESGQVTETFGSAIMKDRFMHFYLKQTTFTSDYLRKFGLDGEKALK